jgi:L-phenylalanine/L-methionine N-acetyltransferase
MSDAVSSPFVVRRATPEDYTAFHRILSGPKAIWGTIQMPYSSPEIWRKRLAEPVEGIYFLLACVETEVVGEITIQTFPSRPRRRHVGTIFMAVRDDWQGRGAGTALMQAAVDLADDWLNLLRLELDVYTDNEPALKLYKKFGFEIECTHKQFAFRAGQYADTFGMGRIRQAQS